MGVVGPRAGAGLGPVILQCSLYFALAGFPARYPTNSLPYLFLLSGGVLFISTDHTHALEGLVGGGGG